MVRLTTAIRHAAQGHWGFLPFSNGTECALDECSTEADWTLPLDALLGQLATSLRPAVLLANWGLWALGFFPPKVLLGNFTAMQSAVAGTRSIALYRSTTPEVNKTHLGHFRDLAQLEAANMAGVPILDAWQLLAPLHSVRPVPMWDARHYWGYPYQELNNYLLNIIC